MWKGLDLPLNLPPLPVPANLTHRTTNDNSFHYCIDHQVVHTSTKSDRRRGYVSVSSLSFQGAPVDPRDIQGRTPLFLAASAGGTDTVQLLMDRGADITLKDVELRSPLHAAIADGDSSTMEALLKVIRLVIKQKNGYLHI